MIGEDISRERNALAYSKVKVCWKKVLLLRVEFLLLELFVIVQFSHPWADTINAFTSVILVTKLGSAVTSALTFHGSIYSRKLQV
jgi:hypothetical protein